MGEDIAGRKRTIILPDDLDDEVVNSFKTENFTQKIIELLKLGIKEKKVDDAIVTGDMTRLKEEIAKKQAENHSILVNYFSEVAKENNLRKELAIHEQTANYGKELNDLKKEYEESRNNIVKKHEEIVGMTTNKYVQSIRFFEEIQPSIEKLESGADKLKLIRELLLKYEHNFFISEQLRNLERMHITYFGDSNKENKEENKVKLEG